MDHVLFVTPAVPRPTGGGLRMRGWLFLQGLARHYRVTLVAGSPGFPDESTQDLSILGNLVDDVILLRYRASHDAELVLRHATKKLGFNPNPSWDWAVPTRGMRRSLGRFAARPFVRVHVFRLYMLPVALAVLDPRSAPPIDLDLDDWESRTRLAILGLTPGQSAADKRRLRAEAAAIAGQERAWLPRCERVFVCSSDDATAVSQTYGLDNVAVVRNAVTVPPMLPTAQPVAPAELLFLGSLGYAPNAHGVRFLLDDVLPQLRSASSCPIRFVVAAPAPVRTCNPFSRVSQTSSGSMRRPGPGRCMPEPARLSRQCTRVGVPASRFSRHSRRGGHLSPRPRPLRGSLSSPVCTISGPRAPPNGLMPFGSSSTRQCWPNAWPRTRTPGSRTTLSSARLTMSRGSSIRARPASSASIPKSCPRERCVDLHGAVAGRGPGNGCAFIPGSPAVRSVCAAPSWPRSRSSLPLLFTAADLAIASLLLLFLAIARSQRS